MGIHLIGSRVYPVPEDTMRSNWGYFWKFYCSKNSINSFYLQYLRTKNNVGD